MFKNSIETIQELETDYSHGLTTACGCSSIITDTYPDFKTLKQCQCQEIRKGDFLIATSECQNEKESDSSLQCALQFPYQQMQIKGLKKAKKSELKKAKKVKPEFNTKKTMIKYRCERSTRKSFRSVILREQFQQELRGESSNTDTQQQLNNNQKEINPMKNTCLHQRVKSDSTYLSPKKANPFLRFSSIEQIQQQKVIAFEFMLRVTKAYNLERQTLFLGLSLLSRSLHKAFQEGSIFLMTPYELLVMAMVCLNLSSKYYQRMVFKVKDLLKINGFGNVPSFQPEQWRQTEFQVLQLVGFKVGDQSTLDEIIEQTLKSALDYSNQESQSEIQLTEEIKNKAFLMGLMLNVFQEVTKPFNKNDVAAAAVYMAVKLHEKENRNQKLMTRSLFDTILGGSQATQEGQVFERASLLFNVIKNSKKYFIDAPLAAGEIKNTFFAQKQ